LILKINLNYKKLTKLYNLFLRTFNELNPQLKKYYIFLGASLVFSIGLQIVLGMLGVPWYISIGLVMAIFILLPMYMRRRQAGNFGGSGSGSGGGFFGNNGMNNSTSVKYVCLVCQNKHNGGSCPRCGSKMQRADF
jgi:hypothetical protein